MVTFSFPDLTIKTFRKIAIFFFFCMCVFLCVFVCLFVSIAINPTVTFLTENLKPIANPVFNTLQEYTGIDVVQWWHANETNADSEFNDD